MINYVSLPSTARSLGEYVNRVLLPLLQMRKTIDNGISFHNHTCMQYTYSTEILSKNSEINAISEWTCFSIKQHCIKPILYPVNDYAAVFLDRHFAELCNGFSLLFLINYEQSSLTTIPDKHCRKRQLKKIMVGYHRSII